MVRRFGRLSLPVQAILQQVSMQYYAFWFQSGGRFRSFKELFPVLLSRLAILSPSMLEPRILFELEHFSTRSYRIEF